jgi:hypothetical protein
MLCEKNSGIFQAVKSKRLMEKRKWYCFVSKIGTNDEREGRELKLEEHTLL